MNRLVCLILIVCLSHCKQSTVPTGIESSISGKTITVTPTAGWLPEQEQIISQPSNIITVDGYSYVFYVKEASHSPVAGTGYSGTIYYAFSRDQGHTWSEQGLLLSKGISGSFDAGGVSRPTIIATTGESNFYYLYYVGVNENFNNSDASDDNKTNIGIAKLIFNETNGGIRLAIKINGGKPVIAPSETGSGRFDAFRVDQPQAINKNGQLWIYYTGLDKPGGTARLGLAIAADINVEHIKQNGQRALLDGSPSLIQKNDIGVLTVFTDTQIVWYAEDGLHFSKLKTKFPTTLKGAKANVDAEHLTWGLTDPSSHGQPFARWEIK